MEVSHIQKHQQERKIVTTRQIVTNDVERTTPMTSFGKGRSNTNQSVAFALHSTLHKQRTLSVRRPFVRSYYLAVAVSKGDWLEAYSTELIFFCAPSILYFIFQQTTRHLDNDENENDDSLVYTIMVYTKHFLALANKNLCSFLYTFGNLQ